jgi:hypothetical protein
MANMRGNFDFKYQKLRKEFQAEYRAWHNMKNRCYAESTKDQGYYRKKNIKVYDEWINSFENFIKYVLEYMGRRPSPYYTLERINNDGNYEPGNIKWATRSEQARNRTNTKLPLKDLFS